MDSPLAASCLLRESLTELGVVFYTNYDSQKGATKCRRKCLWCLLISSGHGLSGKCALEVTLPKISASVFK